MSRTILIYGAVHMFCVNLYAVMIKYLKEFTGYEFLPKPLFPKLTSKKLHSHDIQLDVNDYVQ
jgi:hypothetical protein